MSTIPPSATTSADERSTARSLSPGRTPLTVIRPRAPVSGEMPDVTAGRAPPSEEQGRARAEASESKRAASESEEEEGVDDDDDGGGLAEIEMRIRPSILCFLLRGLGGCHRDNGHGGIDEAIIFVVTEIDFWISKTRSHSVLEKRKNDFQIISKNVFFFLPFFFF